MRDITHTSLPSKAHVMRDTKGWSYLYSNYLKRNISMTRGTARHEVWNLKLNVGHGNGAMSGTKKMPDLDT